MSSSSSSAGSSREVFSDTASEVMSSSLFVTASSPCEKSWSFKGSKGLFSLEVAGITTVAGGGGRT